MSWLSAMTGKAEDFLNKLDRSAADVFHLEEETHGPPVIPHTMDQPSGQSHTSLSPSFTVPARLHDTARFGPSTASTIPKSTLNMKSAISPSISAARTAGNVASTARTAGTVASTVRTAGNVAPVTRTNTGARHQDSDEALFDFLNSKEPAPAEGGRKAVPAMNVKSSGHPNSESGRAENVRMLLTSSAHRESIPSAWGKDSWKRGDNCGAALTSVTPADTEQSEILQSDSPTYSHDSADPEALAEAMEESPEGSVSGRGDTQHEYLGQMPLSAVEVENGLLKDEVASLTQEMASVIDHAKKAQAELSRTKDQLWELSSHASLQEQQLHREQAREQDLQEALNAKDTQVATLRVQLETADREVIRAQRELDSVRYEQERLRENQRGVNGEEGPVRDGLRQQLADLQTLLTREQQAHALCQQEASQRHSRMEQEHKALALALTAADSKVSEEKARAAEVSAQLKTVKGVLESTRQEMAEYKEKASRILQSKERLISSLRDGSEASGSVEGGVSVLEYQTMHQERDMLREELHITRINLDSTTSQLQEVEAELQQEVGEAQDTIRALEDKLHQEHTQRTQLEQELLMQKQDLQYTLDDLYRQKVNFQTRITDREAEIERLRSQLTTKSLSSRSESELEDRVRALTESVIQKQTVVEALSTENTSLTLQLERLGQQYREAENSLMRSAITSSRTGDQNDDMRQRLPVLMREGVTDTEVTRRVKHYVNSVDRFSVRLGVFLRRYPAARVFVLVYMMLLHLWVMVVLATYQQEMHRDS